MIKSDIWIRKMALEHGMIDPFLDKRPKTQGVISSGLTVSGYDVRLNNRFKIFTNTYADTIIDPKNFNENAFVDFEGDVCIIPPNSFVLGSSMETFKMPRDIKGICEGKSTYARCAQVVPVTPLEPGWEGELTLEISNTAPLPAKIYAFEGIAQITFHDIEPCEFDYSQRSGKYQGQQGITLPTKN